MVVLACFTGVVTGNFTDEEEEDPFVSGDSVKEVLLQKDQVLTTFVEGNMVSTINSNTGLRKYFGVVVGVLSVIVLVMIVAIVFIVLYQKRLKASAGHTVLPGSENRVNLTTKVSYILLPDACTFLSLSRNKHRSL